MLKVKHLQKNKNVAIAYDDSERTFDFELAEKFNMPINNIEWYASETVEDFRRKLWKFLKESSKIKLYLNIS